MGRRQETRSTKGGRTRGSITLRFPMILPLSREREPLLRRCVGLSTVIISAGSHNRPGRWDNIVSGRAAGERLNRAWLGIRVPGCSVASGLWGRGPAICQGPCFLLWRTCSIAAQTGGGGGWSLSCYRLHCTVLFLESHTQAQRISQTRRRVCGSLAVNFETLLVLALVCLRVNSPSCTKQ